jgi:sugar phosphate isomerase/epimerase
MARVAGKRALDWFLEAGGPDLEIQLDVYWAQVAGVDPVAYMQQLGSRLGSLHLKDKKELGGGPVNLGAVIRAGRIAKNLVAWVVEQEEFSGTVWDGIAASARYAQKLLSS